MARRNAKVLPADVQETLLDAPGFLRELVHAALQEVLESEMTEHVGAERHERTPDRTGQRNGYKPRTLSTRVGTLTLMAP
jgi:putative transposase